MIKILIVDDSPTETALLKYLFGAQKDMEVIGTATNGEDAITMTKQLNPDIITMDIQMPILNGFEATRAIMAEHPTPIVVISSALSDPTMNTTFKAMEAGALSVLKKPHPATDGKYAEEHQRIIDTVRSMSEIKVVKRRFHVNKQHKLHVNTPKSEFISRANFEILAIGASVGGPQALRVVLEKLPADFPVPIVIVQHMTQGFIGGFTHWLNNNVALTIKSATENEILKPGHVYFAPDHFHLEVKRQQGKLIAHLVKKPPVAGFCPSATVLIESVAKVCGKRGLGLLLTGMGTDGAHGLLELKKVGGHTLIQDKDSAVVFGMAGTAKDLDAVDLVIELPQISEYLMRCMTAAKV